MRSRLQHHRVWFRVLAAAAVSTILVTAGCSSNTVTGTPEPEGSSGASESAGAGGSFSPGAGVVPAGLESFYDQTFSWGSCDGFVTDDDPLGPSVECAKIKVPVDYDKPTGATAEIAISRIPASGTKKGSVLFNPGGPGASGLAMVSQADKTSVSEDFDRVGFDPRGIGASTPAIRCLTTQETDAQRQEPDVDVSPAGIAATENEHRDYIAKCVQRTGADVLAHVGTREVVRDMDVIRSVLGDAKLTYVGYSYGTRIGSTYAETFPQNVRAMVLDGAIDPTQDPVDEAVKQGAGFEKAFEGFAADCAKVSGCALGNDPSVAVKNFRALVDPLIAKPVGTTDPRGLSYSDAITGTQQALYSPSLWRLLRVGLSELQQGRGDTLLRLADSYTGKLEDGTYSNIDDAFNAIRCVDDPPMTDRAEAGIADTRYRQAAPFLDDGMATGSAPLDVCAFWPVPNTASPHAISAPGLTKTVVISTTNDPATPYQAGVDLAKQLDASLITFRGTQHTVSFSGVQCVDDPVAAYLSDLTVPDADLTC